MTTYNSLYIQDCFKSFLFCVPPKLYFISDQNVNAKSNLEIEIAFFHFFRNHKVHMFDYFCRV